MIQITEEDLDSAKEAIHYFNGGGPPAGSKFEEVTSRGDPTKDAEGIRLWRQPGPNGVFEYLILGAAPFKVETFFKVLDDLEYHKKWDDHCASLKVIANEGDTDYVYWDVKYPLLMSNRDYVYARRKRIDEDGTYVFCTKATSLDTCPEVRGKIRVTDYEGTYVLRQRPGENVTEYVYFMYDDPKGSIPKKILNWVASTAIPGLLRKLYGACEALERA